MQQTLTEILDPLSFHCNNPIHAVELLYNFLRYLNVCHVYDKHFTTIFQIYLTQTVVFQKVS